MLPPPIYIQEAISIHKCTAWTPKNYMPTLSPPPQQVLTHLQNGSSSQYGIEVYSTKLYDVHCLATPHCSGSMAPPPHTTTW